MSTLLLRMDAPMQSWGYDSEFTKRRTLRHPTKSAVLGMLACALGWDREHDLSALRALRFGVLVKSEGNLERDYQTVSSHKERDGRGPSWDTKQSHRWYITDAKSVIGLESDDKEWLQKLSEAVASPIYATFCGRKAFPAPVNPVIGVVDKSINDALLDSGDGEYALIENKSGDGDTSVDDTPLSFSMINRLYAPTSYDRIVTSKAKKSRNTESTRDPMTLFSKE